MVSCIILAGGESKRFGEDKTFYNFNGISFLGRALTAAMEVADDIIICGRNESRIKDYRAEAENAAEKSSKAGKKRPAPAIIIDDKNCGFKGPLRGIYSSIKRLKGEIVLIMEVDAPFFSAYAARELISKIKSENVKAAVPLWPDSTVEPLLACYKIKDVVYALDMLNGYALNLKEHFLFNDSVNILRLLPSVYYYNIFDMAKNNQNLTPYIFMNMNCKKDIEDYNINKRIFNKGGSKSVKIRKANRFFDLASPKNEPYGILAKAFYYWWVYAKTGNYFYFRKSFENFQKDGSMYYDNELNFMGDKIIKMLPDPVESFKTNK